MLPPRSEGAGPPEETVDDAVAASVRPARFAVATPLPGATWSPTGTRFGPTYHPAEEGTQSTAESSGSIGFSLERTPVSAGVRSLGSR